MPRLILIDASGFIFRAYHAMPPLTNPQGVPVGAVYGFINMLVKVADNMPADYIACVFDVARVTFRNRIYAEYKAHRPPPPDDLIPQFALVRDASKALNIAVVESPDYEADDVIATYAKCAREQGIEVVIISSDKDLMQLVGEGVTMFDAMKQKPIGEPEVLEKFGVAPNKVRDVLALMGDSSDNVPGVPGIGPKTAAELIQQFGDLETLLERAGEIKQPKRRETLQQHTEAAKLSKQLITLDDNAPMPCAMEALETKTPDPATLNAFLELHGFHSLMSKFKNKFSGGAATPSMTLTSSAAPSPAPTATPTLTRNYSLVSDAATLESWLNKARAKGAVAFDIETDQLSPMRANLVGFSLCVDAGEACYVPLAHVEAGHAQAVDLFNAASAPKRIAGQMAEADALALIKPFLEDASILKIGHNIKYDALVMKRYGITITPIDDTMLISYVLSAGAHGQGMDELAELHLGIKTISYDEVTGTGKARLSFAEVELEKAKDYAAEDADVTLQLHQHLKPELIRQKLLSVYETIERPLVPVILEMEYAGVKIDANMLTGLSNKFALALDKLEAEIHALAGHPFNVASPKQLGEVLFDEMQLPGGKKSAKTGAYSTDNQILEELAEQGIAIAENAIEWRQIAKLKSTYTDALREQINPETGRVHTSYSMAITSTGRLSSTDPNLQNIPIRTPLGRSIRSAFIAKEGCKLISADYSQIELRLLAHVAEIAPLKQAFLDGLDIHAATASAMFNVPVDAVTPELRRNAKTINFGIIYGISAHGLAMRLGIERTEAAEFIAAYFQQYPGIRDYMETTKDFARTHGYVETLFGRRCYLPGIQDKNAARRQFFERAAINAPLQGTAADVIKRAMLKVQTHCTADFKMLLQVHDELIFEVKESLVDHALNCIKPAMEGAANFSVPLTVEMGAGNDWGAIH